MEKKHSPVIIAGKQQNWAKGTAVLGARGFIFLSGSPGINHRTGEIPKSPGDQARLALENIKAILEEYGSSLENIVHIFQFVKGQFPDGNIINSPKWVEISKAMQEFWRDNYPEFLFENNCISETLIGVTSLAVPGFEVEIQAIASIP